MMYLKGVTTINLNESACVGCGNCLAVCPRAVLAENGKKVRIQDKDRCIECGACVTNCPTGALAVEPGVGCAAYILSAWINGKENASCCC